MPHGVILPVRALEGRGEVGEPEEEPGDLLALHQQLDQRRVCHRDKVRGDLADLLLAEGIELVPVGVEGLVVHRADVLRAPDERRVFVLNSGTSKLPRFRAISATRLHPVGKPEAGRLDEHRQLVTELDESFRLDARARTTARCTPSWS